MYAPYNQSVTNACTTRPRQMKVTVMLLDALRYVTLRQQHDRPRDMASQSRDLHVDACHYTITPHITRFNNALQSKEDHTRTKCTTCFSATVTLTMSDVGGENNPSVYKAFLSAIQQRVRIARNAERCNSQSNSVRPSRSGDVSRRMKIRSCWFHRLVGQSF